MQLLALVREETPRLHRVQLHQDLQGPIEQLFRAQARSLLHEDLTPVPFEAGHNPESDEIHFIEPFDDPEQLLASASDPLQCPIFQDAMLDRLIGLLVVLDLDGTESGVFQTFDKRRSLQNGRFTVIRMGEGYGRLQHAGFVLDNHAAAVLQGHRLHFSKFAAVSRLFDLTDYFQEATDEDLGTFANLKVMAVDDSDLFLKLANTSRIRKQVTLVLESEILSKVDVGTIVRRARSTADLALKTTGSGKRRKLVMPDTRAELKDMLDFLQENRYKGCLSGTGFVANSKRVAAGRP